MIVQRLEDKEWSRIASILGPSIFGSGADREILIRHSTMHLHSRFVRILLEIFKILMALLGRFCSDEHDKKDRVCCRETERKRAKSNHGIDSMRKAYESWECADLSLRLCNIRNRHAGNLW